MSVEESVKKLAGRSLMIGIPSYDNTVMLPFAKSFASTSRMFAQMQMNLEVYTVSGCAFIDKARDAISHVFMNHSKATDLLFIDSDISWNEHDVLKLMINDKDVACGVYCHRTTEPVFTVHLTGEEEDGLLQAKSVPAGFLRIRRDALQKIKDATPELAYIDDNFDGEIVHAYFKQHIENFNYFREDVAFSRRWFDIGDGIWVDPSIKLGHWEGVNCFSHDFEKALASGD